METQRIALLLAVALVAGCDAMVSSEPAVKASGACTSMPGAEVTATFPGGSLACNFSNLQYSVDGVRETSGLVSTSLVFGDLASESRCAARATAFSTFPAGSSPGVLLGGSYTGVETALDGDARFYVRTYLGGQLQEESNEPGEIIGVNGTGGYDGILTFRTTLPFDAVELVVGEVAEQQSLMLYEFCSDAPA